MKLNPLFATLIAAAAFAAPASAQQPVRLQLAAGSTLSLEGTSTLHGFTCKTDKLEAFIDVDPGYRLKQMTEVAHPILKTRVIIPVKSLKCGDGKLEKNMYETLKADKNATITYILSTYELIAGSRSATGFSADTKGLLTISGKENSINMPIKSERAVNGSVSATGTYALLMTDFGIKPPKFMFGTLKVGNKITVKFNIKANAQAVAFLSETTALAAR